VDAVGAAVVLPAAGFACFFVFFTFFVVFVVPLLGVVGEAAGACAAITVPIIRGRPTKAETNVFMGSLFFLFRKPSLSSSIMRDGSIY